MLIRRILPVALLAVAIAASSAHAAKRLGGGASIGRQSSNVTQREAARAPATASPAPAQAGAPTGASQNAAPATPATAAPAQAPRRPWGGMLGGLAAGLGLAWLANSLGLGAAFGNVLMMVLLAVAAFALFAMFSRARRGPQPAGGLPADVAALPRQYSPDKVGNDASARPWERNSTAFEAPAPAAAPAIPAAEGVRIGGALPGGATWAIPAGFDVPGFVAAAKKNFMILQDAWDRSDLPLLRSMMTDHMLDEIRTQLAERERQLGGRPNQTEVVMLEAQLLGIEDQGGDYLASVEFTGLIREDAAASPAPFREVWNMAKPRDGGSGWLVAGVQALQ